MKRNNDYDYEFNIKEELKIYSQIGERNSFCRNYCEWHSYVCEKYGGNQYTESMLKNFVHYLKREKNIVMGSKEIWSGCTVPLLTVFITIAYTLVFSVVNVINTYNNSINTLTDEEFMRYSGYDVKMLYTTLEQNFSSGVAFYTIGAVLMILTVLFFLNIVSFKIRDINLKNELYSDYMMIIQEIIENKTIQKQIGGENGS